MKILFLDVDGVLNSQVFYEKRKLGIYPDDLEICPERLQQLNEVCCDLDIKIVISSSWRFSMYRLFQQFNLAGGADFNIIDKTPYLVGDWIIRGNEILHWIQMNEDLIGCKQNKYKDYLIIDDDDDFLLSQKNNFIQTDFYSGITPNVIDKIREFFI